MHFTRGNVGGRRKDIILIPLSSVRIRRCPVAFRFWADPFKGDHNDPLNWSDKRKQLAIACILGEIVIGDPVSNSVSRPDKIVGNTRVNAIQQLLERVGFYNGKWNMAFNDPPSEAIAEGIDDNKRVKSTDIWAVV